MRKFIIAGFVTASGLSVISAGAIASTGHAQGAAVQTSKSDTVSAKADGTAKGGTQVAFCGGRTGGCF